jgi:DNA invertase Pin-like site-specific DNA recombinase
MTKGGKASAVIYARQSQDKQRSTDEQAQIGRDRAAAEGWPIHRVYRDGVSASRHAKAQRKNWPRLLADLDRPDVGVLWLWESSRGDRALSSWSALLDRCREHAVRIYVETHGRLYDMANPRDWRTLAEDGVDSHYESEKTSLRVQRAMAANAAEGKPHGRIPYGYQRRYDERNGAVLGQEPYEPEAQVVRELYDRLRRGHALVAIARDLESRGVRSRSGKPLSPQHLRDIAMRALYAGLRTSGNAGGKRDPYSLVGATEAKWPPLVPREVYFDVRHRLTQPSRRTSRPGRGVHLLSMIARCDECGSPLTAMYRGAAGRQYRCQERGCVRIDADDLDGLATEVMLGYLARPDVYESLRDRGDDAETVKVRGELGQARAELAELRAAVGGGQLSVASLVAAEPGLLARVAALEARERELATPGALRGLISPGKDVAWRWRAAPMSTRREVARLLLAPDLLGELRVQPRPPGWRQAEHMPAIDRVTWRHS